MLVHKNILMLQEIAKALGELRGSVVFAGGATTQLYITDPLAPESVPSDDVDFVVEVTSQGDFAEFEGELRKRGFKDAPGEKGVICRKLYGSIQVDAMPSDGSFGFTNEWYPDAIAEKMRTTLPDGQVIQIFSLPYFFATKFVAYWDRGGDPRTSQDMEDILSVVDGNPDVAGELQKAPEKARKYVADQFRKLLQDRLLFEEAVQALLCQAGEPAGRVTKVMQRIRAIVE